MKCAVVGYVPPPTYKGAKSFLENMSRNRPANEMLLYSDHSAYGYTPIANPEKILWRNQNKWAVNNAIFITGVRMAAKCGFTHIIYIESDCRFGTPGWDAIMFEEYFSLPFPAVAAGSLVSHSCTNGGGEFYRRFEDMIGYNRRVREHPIPIYGVPAGHADQGKFPPPSNQVVQPGDQTRNHYKPAVYPNGALGVYDVAWLCELFHLKPDGSFKEGHSMEEIALAYAWDHCIGMGLYDRFGVEVFDVVAHLKASYSAYGNVINTEAERLQMLRDKKIVAVHQVKEEVVG